MPSSRALSLLLAGTLAVTLGIKALTRQPPEPDTDLFAREVGQSLRAAGYQVSLRRLGSGVYTYGQRDGCRLMITEQDAFGTRSDRNNQLAREVGPLHFGWRGRRYETPPRAEILLRFLVRRERVRIGLSPPRSPLAAIASGPDCAAVDTIRLAPSTLPR